MSKAKTRSEGELVTALEGCRFALHCALLGYQDREDWEGSEIVAEVLAESQQALAKACSPEPPRPICSGCSPIEPFEDKGTVTAWREAHPGQVFPAAREREGRPQMPRFNDAERFLVAAAIRDWIHEQPWSECGFGADTCPDWPKAFEIRDIALAPLEHREGRP